MSADTRTAALQSRIAYLQTAGRNPLAVAFLLAAHDGASGTPTARRRARAFIAQMERACDRIEGKAGK